MIASPEIWEDLSATPLAKAVAESFWIYPALETLHILGLALVVGSIVSFDLRVLGLSRHLSVTGLGRHLLPWVWAGFVINALSGALLFISDAAEFAANPALQVKLLLIVAAGLNALVFQRRLYRDVSAWDVGKPAPPAARFSAALSIVLWLGVAIAGRMIAYVK